MANRKKIILCFVIIALWAMIAACSNKSEKSTGKFDPARLEHLGLNYTRAWNSQTPDMVATYFAKTGALTINNGTPAVGRKAIAEVAQGFMVAFPDLHLVMDSLVLKADRAEYHWTFTGTNTGPKGTGNKVHFSGFESWQINVEGLIQDSQGTFDAAEYAYQLEHGI